jgi:hypothetical protein
MATKSSKQNSTHQSQSLQNCGRVPESTVTMPETMLPGNPTNALSLWWIVWP